MTIDFDAETLTTPVYELDPRSRSMSFETVMGRDAGTDFYFYAIFAAPADDIHG